MINKEGFEKDTAEMAEMIKMGCSYRQVANSFGVSVRCVHNRIKRFCPDVYNLRSKKSESKKIIFPNIEKWLKKNNKTVADLAEAIDMPEEKLNKKLMGKTNFSIYDIRGILKYTGGTFERMFKL